MSGHSKWASIKHSKGKADKQRSKIFSKLSKEISVAAKLGDKDPVMNPRLRSAIQAARSANMPKENIERAIDKSSAAAESNFENLRYEGFGPDKIAVIVETLTDNKNRSFKNAKKFLDKALPEFVGAQSHYASLNSLAFDGFKNYHDALPENIQNASSKRVCMDASQININVCGDPRIHSGAKIRIKIPKSVDPELDSDTRSTDKNKSGVYIVYDIEHKFSYDQEYHMNLLCKKDTSQIDYDQEIDL